MTFGAPETETSNNVRIPSIVLLGADALLAALPATPIQLAHACMLIGYQNVVPSSWGDELIAGASLRALRDHGQRPAIQCSCPHVANRLLAVGTDLRPFLLSLVAPPVALARYLRALHGSRTLHLTYVGRCPAATDESIDARITPEELLATFADQHIAIEAQPDYFDSVIPPDRRRYRSQPGGLPTPEMLWSTDGNGSVTPRSLVELFGDELPVELAQHLLSGKPALIDVAPTLGCVCSGAAPEVEPMHARNRVAEIEPPRAMHPILDESIVTETALSLPPSARNAIDVLPSNTSTGGAPAGEPSLPNKPSGLRDDEMAPMPRGAGREIETALPSHVPPAARRFSPARGVARLTGVGLPTARDVDGRQLPRTYVARRRAPTRVNRIASAEVEAPLEPGAEAPPVPESAATVVEQIPRAMEVSGSTLTTGTAAVESIVPRRMPTGPPADEERNGNPRFAERAVALPITRRSDGPPRAETPPLQAADRPVMQLLTLGLLISMIVLVSAAVGVLVGRWMTQH